MDTYENILKTGDNAPNVTAGDANSPLLVVIQGTPIPDPDDPSKNLVNTMPPNQGPQGRYHRRFQTLGHGRHATNSRRCRGLAHADPCANSNAKTVDN